MTAKEIAISVINVELTEEQKSHIYQQFTPLLRLINHHGEVTCDVIIRSIRRPLSGETYCVMTRVKSDSQTFYAVGMAHTFLRAVRESHDDLRKTMSRSYTPDTQTIEHIRKKVHDRYFVGLFV